MKPKICVSVMPRSADEGKALRDKAERKGADLVEIRLDRLERPAELKHIGLQTEVPKIATNRPTSQGGEFRGSEDERFRTLLDAAQAGFDYVDLEDSSEKLGEKIDAIRASGAKTITSHHNLESTPPLPELEKILGRISRYRPDVCKVVTTARSVQDNLVTLHFLQKASRDFKVVCFAMGEHGKISRVACPIFGSYFTIASLEAGAETAPGQLTIDNLRAIYEGMRLN